MFLFAFLPNQLTPFISGEDFSHADITELGILYAVQDYLQSKYTSTEYAHSQEIEQLSVKGITARKLYDKFYGRKY